MRPHIFCSLVCSVLVLGAAPPWAASTWVVPQQSCASGPEGDAFSWDALVARNASWVVAPVRDGTSQVDEPRHALTIVPADVQNIRGARVARFRVVGPQGTTWLPFKFAVDRRGLYVLAPDATETAIRRALARGPTIPASPDVAPYEPGEWLPYSYSVEGYHRFDPHAVVCVEYTVPGDIDSCDEQIVCSHTFCMTRQGGFQTLRGPGTAPMGLEYRVTQSTLPGTSTQNGKPEWIAVLESGDTVMVWPPESSQLRFVPGGQGPILWTGAEFERRDKGGWSGLTVYGAEYFRRGAKARRSQRLRSAMAATSSPPPGYSAVEGRGSDGSAVVVLHAPGGVVVEAPLHVRPLNRVVWLRRTGEPPAGRKSARPSHTLGWYLPSAPDARLPTRLPRAAIPVPEMRPPLERLRRWRNDLRERVGGDAKIGLAWLLDVDRDGGDEGFFCFTAWRGCYVVKKASGHDRYHPLHMRTAETGVTAPFTTADGSVYLTTIGLTVVSFDHFDCGVDVAWFDGYRYAAERVVDQVRCL